MQEVGGRDGGERHTVVDEDPVGKGGVDQHWDVVAIGDTIAT